MFRVKNLLIILLTWQYWILNNNISSDRFQSWNSVLKNLLIERIEFIINEPELLRMGHFMWFLSISLTRWLNTLTSRHFWQIFLKIVLSLKTDLRCYYKLMTRWFKTAPSILLSRNKVGTCVLLGVAYPVYWFFFLQLAGALNYIKKMYEKLTNITFCTLKNLLQCYIIFTINIYFSLI